MSTTIEKTCEDAVKRAVELAGSQRALARLIGKKQQHIYNWLNRNKKIPATEVINIEKALNGKLRRHEIRPDLYPPGNLTANY